MDEHAGCGDWRHAIVGRGYTNTPHPVSLSNSEVSHEDWRKDCKKESQKDTYRDSKDYNKGEWGLERLIDPNIGNINMILQKEFSN